jgi:hypothetical protein
MNLATKLAEQVEYNNFKMTVHERPDNRLSRRLLGNLVDDAAGAGGQE